MIENQLIEIRKALSKWANTNTEKDFIILKNKLDLCSYKGCFEEAHLTVRHQKWCKLHYDEISGE